LIEKLGIGHRHNFTPELRDELLRLKEQVWREWPADCVGQPTDPVRTRSCSKAVRASASVCEQSAPRMTPSRSRC
jgi:hypothetical protein